MNLDSLTIAALADEFRLTLMGGRVQNAVQMTPLTFGLEFYAQHQRRYLILSANPQAPRAHLQPQKPRRGEGNETPMLQLMRKYVKGSALTSVEQPAYERVLLFHFSGPHGEITLAAELMGNRSNLICFDSHRRILGLLKPAPAQPNATRALLPNHPYQLPAVEDKIMPPELTIEALGAIIHSVKPDWPLKKALAAQIAGLSPLTIKEILYRSYGPVEPPSGQPAAVGPLWRALQDIFTCVTRHAWSPCLVRSAGGQVSHFSAIALTHLPQAQAIASISEAVAAYFNEISDNAAEDAYGPVRRAVGLKLQKMAERLNRRLEKLEADAAALSDPETFKQKGDALLTYGYQIKPGQTQFEVLWLTDTPLTISLDPALSPAENAQKYFARYQKAKRAAGIIPQQREAIALQQEYVNQLGLDLQLAESRPEIDAVHQALFELLPGPKAARKSAVSAGRPRQFTSPEGLTVWVGKNARQNHHLTFKMSRPDDIWLHARGVPGSHVIISTAPGSPSQATILWAAGLAAFYSKLQSEKQVEVSYTQKRHVRPIKNAPPGLVRVKEEKTVRVTPFTPPG